MKTKSMVAAGALLASCALLTGCGGLAGIGGPTDQDEISYEVSEKVATLFVESGSGDITVSETDRQGIKVVETLYWRGDKPKTEHPVDGDTLTLRYKCEQRNWGSCGVNYRVEVPKGLKVKTDTGSGNLTLRDLSGELEATTGSGDIEANGLAGKKAYAETGSGGAELKYAAVPDSVEVETGSGDVTVRLPQGSYDVTTETGSGDTSVKVTDDPKSPRKVSLKTGSGDATVLAG
ncbi:DUF4097 family beta strand repeat-containing protein [Nonomuraea sp. NPDC046570]|uniref:DUF4097 family beta strand repeat-containing protein n=1 Tax=Nonomuraea sp. NPDC046570 TaxID=3155255 RepID=UPI0033FB9314